MSDEVRFDTLSFNDGEFILVRAAFTDRATAERACANANAAEAMRKFIEDCGDSPFLPVTGQEARALLREHFGEGGEK